MLVQVRRREEGKKERKKEKEVSNLSVRSPFFSSLSLSPPPRFFSLRQVHACGRRLVALTSPFPAACRMIPPGATTGEDEGDQDESGGGGGGCWILVASVRGAVAPRPCSPPRPPPPPPHRGAQGEGSRPVAGEGQVRRGRSV